MTSPFPPAVAPLLPEELLPVNGSDWNVCIPLRTTDGDTQRILRAQVRWKQEEDGPIGDGLRHEVWSVDVVKDDRDVFPKGLAARLINLNTPERGQEGFDQASADLFNFCTIYKDQLRCIVYDTGGGFDRLLVDLYVLSADGKTIITTATQHMLRLGWEPYVG